MTFSLIYIQMIMVKVSFPTFRLQPSPKKGKNIAIGIQNSLGFPWLYPAPGRPSPSPSQPINTRAVPSAKRMHGLTTSRWTAARQAISYHGFADLLAIFAAMAS